MIRSFDETSEKKPRRTNPQASLQSLEGHLSKGNLGEERKEYEAQELVYRAWEAATSEEEEELIIQALAIDPMNVDALLRVVDYSGVGGDEEIMLLREIVATAEFKLGSRTFKELAGSFWGVLETRPYMRARERLADALQRAGRLDDTIIEYRGMLQLNPGDNQGVRYHLLPCLLMSGRLAEARELFDKYPGEFEFNTMFAWGRVLERFLSEDPSGAVAALAGARAQNKHMQAFVKGERRLPRTLPAAYSPGSKEEAVCYAQELRAAWEKHPEAMNWLKEQKAK